MILAIAIGIAAVVAFGRPSSKDHVTSGPQAGYVVATSREIPKLTELQRAARALVESNADVAVHEGLIVVTTRQFAAGGDLVNSDQPVYELVLHGNFTCAACSRPPGATAPTGEYLTLSMDRATLATTDFGITRVRPAIPASALVYSFDF